MAIKNLKGARVEVVEARIGRKLVEVLDEYEKWQTPIRKVAADLGVTMQQAQYWRAKLGFPKRKPGWPKKKKRK